MSEPACECDGPGDCPRYGVRQGPFAWGMCRGENCTPDRSDRFRLKLRLRKDGGPRPQVAAPPASPRPKRTPLQLRPVCRWQGAEVPGCKTCGGPASVIHYCESPDDDADRCVRGPSRDKTVRSCLDCPHHEELS